MGQAASTPEPSSNEKRLIAEYDRLVREGDAPAPAPAASKPDLHQMLRQHDLTQAERAHLERRITSLPPRLDAIERANRARALENRINELYARILAGPNALPENVKGKKRRTGLLDEATDWAGAAEAGDGDGALRPSP